MTDASLQRFWRAARAAAPELRGAAAPLVSFGATPAQADELLALILAGAKTATSSALWDYEAAAERLPAVGDLSVAVDGSAEPRAVLEVTSVETVAFSAVSAAHAYAEGEGDRSLASWRREHERFWRRYSDNERGFAPDMPVVLETFRVVHPGVPRAPGAPA